MDYFNEIKNLIEKQEVNERVRRLQSNNQVIKTYYEIGKLLVEAQGKEKRAKYGEGLLKKWSKLLSTEYGNGYDYTNLSRMRKLYLTFKKVGTSCQQFNLSWSHYRYILKFDDENERNYYINRCIQNNLSVRELINEIKNKSFDRLTYADKKNIKLVNESNSKELSIKDMIHDPIIINVNTNERLSEKVLKKYILNELEHFFLELGTGFSFVGSEYKLTYMNKKFYADLVLFNYNLNSFVILELKLSKAKYKDVHQVLLYRDIIDKTIKKDFHNKTIAILVSKQNDKFILEYVSDMDVFLSTYEFYNTINNV